MAGIHHTRRPSGSDGRSDADLLARIRRSAGSKAGYKQLIRELGLGGGRERRLLLEQLTRLVARGELLRAEGEVWAIPRPLSAPSADSTQSRNGHWTGFEASTRSGRDRLISGKIDLHRDGFAFVRIDAVQGTPAPPANGSLSQKQQDIFIPPNEIHGAMQGDLVLVEEAAPGRDGRRSGRVARVLTRRNPTIVGIFHYGRSHGASRRHRADPAEWAQQVFASPASTLSGNYVIPLDERIGGAIFIADGDEAVAAGPDSPHRMLGEPAREQLQQLSREQDQPERLPQDFPDRHTARFPLEGVAGS